MSVQRPAMAGHHQQQARPSLGGVQVPMQMQMQMQPMTMPMPSSFMMLDEPNMVGTSLTESNQMMPMMLDEPSSVGASRPPLQSPISGRAPPTNTSESQPVPMVLPSMTMTIQSEPGGGSNIELSTNMAATNASSAPLRLQQPRPGVEHHQSDPAGEQYYSSPWRARAPMPDLAKLQRAERLRSRPAGRNQLPPVIVIRNKWRPSGQLQQQPPPVQQQQQLESADYDELVAVGPPQMMHLYQSANGELHVVPPGSEGERESWPSAGTRPAGDLSGEVNTVAQAGQPREPAPKGGPAPGAARLVSPAVKGKQRQAQQGQEKKRPPAGY